MRVGGYSAHGRPNDDELAANAEAGSRFGAYGDPGELALEEDVEGDVAPGVSLSLVYDAPSVPAPKPWLKWAAVGALGLLLLSGGRRRGVL